MFPVPFPGAPLFLHYQRPKSPPHFQILKHELADLARTYFAQCTNRSVLVEILPASNAEERFLPIPQKTDETCTTHTEAKRWVCRTQ